MSTPMIINNYEVSVQ